MSSPSLRQKLHKKLKGLELPAPLAADLEREAAECLALVPALKQTLSFFGGKPLAPAGFVWPSLRVDGQHPRFLGQIAFAEMGLPQPGVLYLFVEYLGSAAEAVRVHGVLAEAGGELSEIEPPELLCDVQELEEMELCHVTGVPSLSLPLHALADRIDEAGGDFAIALEELEWELRPDGRVGQLLGWARSHDGAQDLYRKVHLASRGEIERIYDRKWMGKNEAALQRGAADWRLLLRLDSNQEMSLNINDSDPLFVFTRGDGFGELLGLVLQS